MGPALDVRGGVSSAQLLILDSLRQLTSVEHIATMNDGDHLMRLRLFARALRRIRELGRRDEPIIFHVHFASYGSTLRKSILAKLILRTPHGLVLHAHGAAFDEFYLGLPGYVRRRIMSIFQRSDGFIVLSSQWRRFYAEHLGLPQERVSLLVNPTRLPAAVPDRLGRERVQFLFMGRIGRRKGAFDLLRAFADLPAEARARSSMIFAGDGQVAQLRELARSVGDDVTVHEWLDPQARDQILASSDVLVLPSRQEGVPMAVLEAMAYGLPVIATPVGGIPDVVTDQREGLLVELGDQRALTAAMARLAVDEPCRLRLGAAARTTAESLDIGHYIDNLTRLYSMIDRNSRSR